MSPGFTPKALANLRIVARRGFCLPFSSLLMVPVVVPDSLAKSS
jgi:hypothetical protein